MAPRKKREIFVGTSGFYYDGWRGIFYPENLKKEKMLSYYAERFSTVEINSTFYHLPKEKTARRWHDRVGTSFVFSVKGSRYITHRRKLKDVKDSLELFYRSIQGLRRKIGAILFQLPPSLRRDNELLRSFLELLDRRRRHVLEFRHESWFETGVYEILRSFGAAFCAQSHPRLPEDFERTSDFLYIRFHGVPKLYTSNYSDAELERWADRIAEASGGTASVYCYFNNDVDGHAVRNAEKMREILYLRLR